MSTRETTSAMALHWRSPVSLLVLCALVLVLLRISPIGPPLVFSDEYSYAAWTYHLYHSMAPPAYVPALSNWLYLRLYEFTHVGHGDFLAAARAINAIFAALSAGGLYLICRPWLRGVAPVLSALAYSVLFVGGYTAYFMPEAMFFAACVLMVLWLVHYVRSPGLYGALAIGVVGALTTAIKAHGALLAPVMLVGVVLANLPADRARLRALLVHALALLMSWWVTSTLVGRLLGDAWSLNPLGAFYTDMASGSATKLGWDRMHQVLELGLSHLSAMALVAGGPVLLAVAHAARTVLRARSMAPDDRQLGIVIIALLCGLGGMLAVTVLFSVSQAGAGPYETLTRLHGRYYEHLLVLVAVCGVVAAPRLLSQWKAPARWALAALAVVLFVLAVRICGTLGWQNFNDFSVGFAFFASPVHRYYACIIGIFAIIAAVTGPKKSHVALAVGLVAWLFLNAYETERLRYSLEPQAGDRGGELISRIEAGGDRASILVLSSAPDAQFYRLAFHLLDENVDAQIGTAAPACPGSGLAWVVVVGPSPMACNATEVIEFGEMKVGRVLQKSSGG